MSNSVQDVGRTDEQNSLALINLLKQEKYLNTLCDLGYIGETEHTIHVYNSVINTGDIFLIKRLFKVVIEDHNLFETIQLMIMNEVLTQEQKVEIMKTLLDEDEYNPLERTDDGQSLYSFVIENGYIYLIDLFISRGFDIPNNAVNIAVKGQSIIPVLRMVEYLDHLGKVSLKGYVKIQNALRKVTTLDNTIKVEIIDTKEGSLIRNFYPSITEDELARKKILEILIKNSDFKNLRMTLDIPMTEQYKFSTIIFPILGGLIEKNQYESLEYLLENGPGKAGNGELKFLPHLILYEGDLLEEIIPSGEISSNMTGSVRRTLQDRNRTNDILINFLTENNYLLDDSFFFDHRVISYDTLKKNNQKNRGVIEYERIAKQALVGLLADLQEELLSYT